jgi:hypothetical protein
MARPKKDPKLVKDEMLRIPVSATEKDYISDAAVAEDGEFASWARAILLKAAEDYHKRAGTKSRSGRSKDKIGALS